ncbi:MFS transporter [Actinomadura chibensis]|uniref:MFS transporter n=1 Tax=Actinomadura chibensis TaxID=392828 RepID=A0A5D0NPU1_9ACTN|nr:MFS transporter [Actinomadura chibensis]TYB46319.1 MFS transporter [Actinomadura chibensis]
MTDATTHGHDEPPPLAGDGMPETDALGLRATLRQGGWAICSLAVPLVAMEQLCRDASTTLAPDIRDSFGISDATLVAISGFTGVTLTLGGPPMAWLADRVGRKHLVVGSACLGTLAMIGAGLAQSTLQLFVAYALTGVAAAYSNPVFLSMISDAYPLEGRGRIYSMHAMATPLGQAVGPALAGSIAGLAGGAEAWRWAYLGLAVPYALLAVSSAVFLKEPPRGLREQELLLGGASARAGVVPERPAGLIEAFRQMMRVRTFVYVCMGIGVLGLALYTVPVQLSLLLGDEYGYDALTRGIVFSLIQVPIIAAMVVGGHQFDRTYRKNSERTMHIAALAILAFGGLIVVGVWASPIWLLLAFYVVAAMCNGLALVAVSPLVALVTPVRLRAPAFAILPVFTFLMGGFFGSIFAGFISGTYGPRLALSIAVPPSALAAGFFFLRGSRHLKRDTAAAVRELVGGAAAKPL